MVIAIGPVSARSEDEPVPKGSDWVGTLKRFRKNSDNRVLSMDAELKIVERNGNDVRAELWLDNRKVGLAMEGRVTPGAADNLTLRSTKLLKGELPPDTVGRAPLTGYARNGAIKLKFSFPNEVRFGELELRLKK